MDPQIEVHSAEIEALGQTLEFATRRIQETLDELDAKSTALRGSWSGEASEAYAVAHASWNRSLDEMRAVLASYADQVHTTNERFIATEKDNKSQWV